MSGKKAGFAKLEAKMVYSDAYQSLNAPALKILSYLLLQQRWVKINSSGRGPKYELTNKDDIRLMYSTFQKKPFSMSNSTITRAIDSLLGRGFIRVVSQGGRIKGHQSVYGIDNGWMSWKPDVVVNKRKPFFSRGFAVVDSGRIYKRTQGGCKKESALAPTVGVRQSSNHLLKLFSIQGG